MRPASLFLFLAAVVLFPSPAHADPPYANEVVAKLCSDDPREVAWGAWLAAEHRITAARSHVVPLLKRLAARRGATLRPAPDTVGPPDPLVTSLADPSEPLEPWIVEEHALDLAIRLEILPPQGLVETFAPSHPSSVAALLLTFPDPPARTLVSAFDRFEKHVFKPHAWLALGNLMRRRGTPGFAERLLVAYTLNRRLRVWDRDGPYPDDREPRDSVPYSGWHQMPTGYPPTVVYGLTIDDQGADGEHPVRWYRNLWTDDELIGFGGIGGSYPQPDACRETWLTLLVRSHGRDPEVVAPPHEAVHDIRFVGTQPWDRDLRAWIEMLHAQHWRLLVALRGARLLEPWSVEYLNPRVLVEVVDRRESRRQDLPAVPEVDSRTPAWLLPPGPRPRGGG